MELFFDDVRRRLRVSGDRDRIWERLERHATIATADLDRLRTYDSRLQTKRSVDLVDLQNLLRRLEAQL
jgi:hypothetical protein